MNHTHIAALAVSSFALTTAGCILEEPSWDGDLVTPFICASDDDCVTGYFCKDNACTSVRLTVESPGCIDQDGDGYGCGEDRTSCQFPEEDTDCNNPDINPGAVDLCDGLDNDSDGTTDEPPECERPADCPSANLPDSSFFRCIDNTCVLKPRNTLSEGCDVVLSCVDGAYDDVPETCK